MSGFMVWSPEGRLPTCVHSTLEEATCEAERLRRDHPGRHFLVMAPVRTDADAREAIAYDRGVQDCRSIWVEKVADLRGDLCSAASRANRLAADLLTLRPFQANAEAFQSIVADCQCWFDGFLAAFASREDFERPTVPSRENLRALNKALQDVMRAQRPAAIDDEEIPF